jgi:hypothetical protein
MSADRCGTSSRVLASCLLVVAAAWVCCGGHARAETADAPTPGAGARYHQVIRDFCAQEFLPAAVVEYFAPGAVDVDEGGVLLYPGLAHHSSHNDHRLGVINTQVPHHLVVTWARPGVGRPVSEITVHTAGLQAVPYRAFIEEYELPPEVEWTQDGHLSDIVHHHVVPCGDKQIDVLLHEAVWAGESVGKLSQFTLRKKVSREEAVDPVDAALQARVPAIKECVDGKTPGGFVTVEFRLTPDGTITHLQRTSPSSGYPGLDACIEQELSQITISPCDLESPKPMEYWLSFFK